MDSTEVESKEAAAESFLQMSTFALLGQSAWCQAESHHMGAIRWSLYGTRRVVCASEEALYKAYMKMNPGTVVSFGDLLSYFRNMDEQQAKSFVDDGHVIYNATIEEGSVLYMPPAFVVAELVQSSEMVVGVRKPVVLASHAESLNMIRKHARSIGKNNAACSMISMFFPEPSETEGAAAN
eukprot:6458993-Amphidinium_carterae.4